MAEIDGDVTEMDGDALRVRYARKRAKRLRADGNDQYIALQGRSRGCSMTPTRRVPSGRRSAPA